MGPAAGEPDRASLDSSVGAGSSAAGLCGRQGSAKATELELQQPLMAPGRGSSSSAPVAAAAAGGGAAVAAAAAAAPPRRPLVLPCGHAFCEPCISA